MKGSTTVTLAIVLASALALVVAYAAWIAMDDGEMHESVGAAIVAPLAGFTIPIIPAGIIGFGRSTRRDLVSLLVLVAAVTLATMLGFVLAGYRDVDLAAVVIVAVLVTFGATIGYGFGSLINKHGRPTAR